MFRSPWQEPKDLISIPHLTADEVEALFQLAPNVKARPDLSHQITRAGALGVRCPEAVIRKATSESWTRRGVIA